MIHWRWFMLWISNLWFTAVALCDGLVIYGSLALAYAMD
jgi:hypothetical protein